MTYQVAIVHKTDPTLSRLFSFDKKPDDVRLTETYSKSAGGPCILICIKAEPDCAFYSAAIGVRENVSFLDKVLKTRDEEDKKVSLGYTPWHEMPAWHDLYQMRTSHYLVIRPDDECEDKHVVWFAQMLRPINKKTKEFSAVFWIWMDKTQEFRPSAEEIAVHEDSVYGMIPKLPSSLRALKDFRAYMKRIQWPDVVNQFEFATESHNSIFSPCGVVMGPYQWARYHNGNFSDVMDGLFLLFFILPVMVGLAALMVYACQALTKWLCPFTFPAEEAEEKAPKQKNA